MSCNFPEYFKIFYVPNVTNIDALYSYDFQSDERFKLRAQKHYYIKLQAFSSQKIPFYNSSSLSIKWTLDNDRLATLNNFNSKKGYFDDLSKYCFIINFLLIM